MNNNLNKMKIDNLQASEVVEDAYNRYAKHVNINRALPSVRDGLKPVQRRIIATIIKSGNHGALHSSSAIVGDCMKCFTGDTEVKTLDGDIRLDELIKDFNGKKIWSKSLDNRDILTNIKNVFITKEVTELLELEFEDGYTVKCTPDHRFLTNNRGWVEAKDLNEDDDFSFINKSKNQLAAVSRNSKVSYREKISNSVRKTLNSKDYLEKKKFLIEKRLNNLT